MFSPPKDSLWLRAQNGDVEGVKKWLQTNGLSQLNAKDADERTPLHWAASGGHLEVVGELLSHGCEVNPLDEAHWTPLLLAVAGGREEVVGALLGKGGDVNCPSETGATPLHYALSKKRWNLVPLLLQSKAKVNATDRGGSTPLHRLADSSDTPQGCEAAQLLIDHGALVNARDADGETPLMRATRAKHGSMVAVLLKNGADPSLESRDASANDF